MFNSLIYFFFYDPTIPTRPVLAVIITVLAWAYALYLIFFKPYKKYPLLLTSYFTSISDAALITLWIYATGEYHSPFFVLYYVSIIAIAFRYSFRVTLVTAFAYAFLYILVFHEEDRDIWVDIFSRMVHLLFAAVASGFLSTDLMERIRDKITIERSAKEAQVAEIKLRRILQKLRDQIEERRKTEKKLQKARDELEHKVMERTEDLFKSNELLRQEIHEREKIEEMLKYKIRELDTFIYRATHDIRGPLSSLLGLVALTKTEEKHEQIMSNLQMMEKSVKRLDTILLDLLNVSLIKHGKVNLSEIDFTDLLDEIIHSISAAPTTTNHFSCSKSLTLKRSFKSDRLLLRTIMQNLLENAYKYRNLSIERPEINIRIQEQSAGVKIEIEDNGIGIPEKIQDQVFDMFFRGSMQSPGTGLGLYIVRNAVDKLGGVIEMKSREGKGTVFTIFLPDLKEEEE
jgi:signal transduction histidine kinase